MVLRVVLTTLLVSATLALPAVDVIVPESSKTTLVEVGSRAMFEAAKAKVQAMVQANGDYDECEKLANSGISDIKSSVETLQNTLNALDTGDKCKDEGQEDVKSAQGAKAEADQAEIQAKDTMDQAYEAEVQLETRHFSFLKESTECAWIQSDPNYKDAENHYNQMVGEHEEAVAHAKAKDEELTAAIDEAARLKHECECRVQAEHSSTWESATANNDANEQAWTQAHNMICVVEHKTHKDCVVPACPTVTKPQINQEAADAECSDSEEHTAAGAETEQADGAETEQATGAETEQATGAETEQATGAETEQADGCTYGCTQPDGQKGASFTDAQKCKAYVSALKNHNFAIQLVPDGPAQATAPCGCFFFRYSLYFNPAADSKSDVLPGAESVCALGNANSDTDCEMSPWGAWSECSAPCGGGGTYRTRTIAVQPVGSGDSCGSAEEEMDCNRQACASS